MQGIKKAVVDGWGRYKIYRHDYYREVRYFSAVNDETAVQYAKHLLNRWGKNTTCILDRVGCDNIRSTLWSHLKYRK